MTEFERLLVSATRSYWSPPPELLTRLSRHCDLLMRWNQRMNLTSLRSVPEIVTRHYAESVFLATHLPNSVRSVADIGTGAGFPGTVLAILRPDCQVFLIESVQRKAVFLRESTRDLPNVRIFPSRSEQFSGSVDFVTTRAVHLNDFLADAVRISPRLLALLGGEALQELQSNANATVEETWPCPHATRTHLVKVMFHVEREGR